MARKITAIAPHKSFEFQRKKVAAYARVSSGKDAMLHSLSAQVSYYSKMIQSRPGWQYVGVYADEAATGTKDNRNEFQRMISDCKSGNIDMIITKSISRFARNTVTLLETVRELKELNVDVYFEEQNIHSMSGDGELMLTILASFAQEESRSVSENCKWRIRHNYEEGIPNGFTLYGYDIKDRVMTVNAEQAEVVRRIFTMYTNGSGSKKICNALNEEGIPSPNGYQWSEGRIMDILKNEKYIGDLLLQKYYSENHISKRTLLNDGRLKQYYVTDNHAPIIDRKTFETVQRIMEEKERTHPHIKAYDYKFKDMVFCGECGAKFARKKVHTGTVSEHFVWKCRTYTHKGKKYCDNKQIPDKTLIMLSEDVDKEIAKIIVHPNNAVCFQLADGSEVTREWKIDRKWSEEMKERNFYNQRRRYL